MGMQPEGATELLRSHSSGQIASLLQPSTQPTILGRVPIFYNYCNGSGGLKPDFLLFLALFIIFDDFCKPFEMHAWIWPSRAKSLSLDRGWTVARFLGKICHDTSTVIFSCELPAMRFSCALSMINLQSHCCAHECEGQFGLTGLGQAIS